MVTTFVNHLYFEGWLICSVDGFYFLSYSYLFTKTAFFMFLGSALDVLLNTKLLLYFYEF